MTITHLLSTIAHQLLTIAHWVAIIAQWVFININNKRDINKIYEEKVLLTSEQIEMLVMSEKDIANGDIISESELDKMDDEWLG
nr:hypothetical protein [uncultured Carboxylicivirga sp.]